MKKYPRSPFRYSGGKSRFIKNIMPLVNTYSKNVDTFIDLFCGGGTVALAWASYHPRTRIVLNDLDDGVYAFWRCVVNPETRAALISRILQTRMTRDFVIECEQNIHTPDEQHRAYYYFLVNRAKHSGCMVGGWMPTVTDRFNINRLVRQIDDVGLLLQGRTSVECKDFEQLVNQYGHDQHVLIFADPPYYGKGKLLYRHFFNSSDHERLAKSLQTATASSVITYDDCPLIRQLYAGHAIARKLIGSYCCSNTRPRASELLLGLPNTENVYRKAIKNEDHLRDVINRIIPLTENE